MKIRLASIDGKLGDPSYNESLMEEEVQKAVKDNVDIIFFPINSIDSNSIDSLRGNSKYIEIKENAITKFKDFVSKVREKNNITVMYDESREFYFQDKLFKLFDEGCEQSLEFLQNAEDHYISKCDSETDFVIVCHGRGTESTCMEIYSNLKMIIYHGKVLATNRYTDSNVLDFDFDELKTKAGSKTPYLDDIKDKNQMFYDITNAQSVGLYNKMKSMNRYKIVIGISGGLDSAVSLLSCVECFKKYHLPLTDIIGVTMPGLGTTERTYKNALQLMKDLGITIRDIDLKPLLRTHLKNIDQPEGKFDVTFEQCQSRERTQVLLDLANRDNAIMIGTGCMSEFALGWMSYGGDHLCMYAIDIGLPKTVVKMFAQHYIDLYNGYSITSKDSPSLRIASVVRDILDGPVSPELLPIDEKGEQHEKTESIIGDYKVQDFFIYHMTVNNVSIKELYNMTCYVFTEYSHACILKWLEIFTLRYFTRAYKKNCYGDGLQLFKFSVSPSYYHVPSDVDYSIWKKEIDELKAELEK